MLQDIWISVDWREHFKKEVLLNILSISWTREEDSPTKRWV